MVGGRGAPGRKGVGSVQKKGPCVGGPVWPSVKMRWREREKKSLSVLLVFVSAFSAVI